VSRPSRFTPVNGVCYPLLRKVRAGQSSGMPAATRDFSVLGSIQTALRHTQLPVQGVPGFYPRGEEAVE
jgi:hypothetical protein